MSDDFWNEFEVRTGRDGKVGIYSRQFNVRCATFNANTAKLQAALAELFDTGLVTPYMKKATGKAVPLTKAVSAKPRRFKVPARS